MHEQIYSGTNNFACKCYVFKLDALKQAKMPKEEEVDQVNQPTNILKASLEFLPVGGTRLVTGSCWNVDDMKKLQAATDEYAPAEHSVRLSKGKTMAVTKES